jgi:Family of unknown function (DUF6547)
MAERRHQNPDAERPSPLDDYKAFIDALVHIRPDVYARWIEENRPWPDLPENRAINEFIVKLTAGQREVLATLLQRARDSGIHDTLAYLNEAMNLEGLRLVRNGSEFPVEPFETQLNYDWTCRREGDAWPEPKSAD